MVTGWARADEGGMSKGIEVARGMRIGAERLRQLAVSETDRDRAREMLRIAAEMDEHAAELERSFVNHPAPARE
jgi:hypothetical protein